MFSFKTQDLEKIAFILAVAIVLSFCICLELRLCSLNYSHAMMIAQEETGKVNIESALKLGKLDTAQKYVLPFTCILALVEGILLGMTSTGRRLIIYMLCLLVIFALFPLIFAQFDNIGHHIINYIDISGAVFERIILATILSRLINKIRRQTGSSQSNVI